jgi:hypothetical protein
MASMIIKLTIASIFLLRVIASNCQAVSKDIIDFSGVGWRCAVAHYSKDGIFTCNFNGAYYPETIFDSTIRKWFVEMKNGDSIFYYRNDLTKIYIWNGRPKNEMYGYEWKSGGGSITLPDKYNGSDTLRIKEQKWTPKY